MSDVEADSRGFEELVAYVERTRGFDLGAYKRTGLERRVRKRMAVAGVEQFPEYVDYLEVHPEEFTQLFNTIMINVTGFFRDPAVWEQLGKVALPAMLSARPADAPIRVWSAACASGEEAYTLAIILCEALGEVSFRERVKIYATDVDDDALAKARSASYDAREVEGVPPDLLEKYFEMEGGSHVFRKDLRRLVIFGHHDLIQDAPISRIDLLACRNALMYFNAEAQAKILGRFRFALNDHGILFLGKAEMLLNYGDSFEAEDIKHRIFTKLPGSGDRARLVPAQPRQMPELIPTADDARLRDVVIDSDPVAQVVLDLSGRLSIINERAREMFNLSSHDLGRSLQELEFSYKPVELRSIYERACSERRVIIQKFIAWPMRTGEPRWLDLTVLPLLDNSGQFLGVKLVFTDVTRYKRLNDDLLQHRQELETAYEELQSANEELETTNEELQSTVEELETTNEELQSTNEELETMNEELQSTNEEMETINDELRQRSDDLNKANAYLESVFSGLRSGVVVMDRDLVVQVWNRRAEDMWGLRCDEVIGKHFLSLDIGLPVDQIRASIRSTLLDGEDGREDSVDAVNRRGRPVTCKVAVSSLTQSGDQVQGVILLMEEHDRAASQSLGEDSASGNGDEERD